MSYQDILKKFQSKAEFEVVLKADDSYEYARSISNSRFHHRPGAVSFCRFPQDVAECLIFCKQHKVPFRVRSGGHHHEGMSSGNGLMVIDLSRLYRDPETNECKISYEEDNGQYAWIPPGMKLQRVYEELRSIGAVIPGGGCQSVNVGGLTQGGGWGVHIRKYGLTCDQLVDVEIVLADGTAIVASELNKNKHGKDGQELLWALRGGGGGNFGVVTRFKFRLCSLNPTMTSFGIFWKKKVDIINMITRWAELHEEDSTLPKELSCTTNMFRVGEEKSEEGIRGRLGGNFYGTKAELIKLLKKEFGSLIPLDGDEPITKDGKGVDSFFSSINEQKIKVLEGEEEKKNTAAESTQDHLQSGYRVLTRESREYIYEQLNVISGISGDAGAGGHIKAVEPDKATFKYDVLPSAPNTTCDMPHPHKVTSLYPKKGIDHRKLANQVYDQLKGHPFLADVNRYMVWHCLGGAMRNPEFEKLSSFAYRDKPYMLQLQAWWNHAGQLRNDQSRDHDYTQWVNDFRQELDSKGWTEGAFINFVDRDIPVKASGDEGRMELLKHYFGKNMERLRAAKTQFDPDNLFDFGMGLLPVKSKGSKN